MSPQASEAEAFLTACYAAYDGECPEAILTAAALLLVDAAIGAELPLEDLIELISDLYRPERDVKPIVSREVQ